MLWLLEFSPWYKRGMRIVHVSDTHNKTPDLPDGDVLIHSGDLTIRGFRIEFYRQLCWLEMQRARYKEIIVVPGNHDLYPEAHFDAALLDCSTAGIVLLHNSEIVIDGVKFYGSAHTPEYHGWGFMLNQCEIYDAWQQIPEDTKVLITHGPPLGILDASYRGEHIGCNELLLRIKEIKPKYHFFGHAHEGKGMVTIGETTFVNSATTVQVIDI